MTYSDQCRLMGAIRAWRMGDPLTHAWRVMGAMRQELLAGKGWKDVYRRAADQMLNQEDIRSGSRHVGTHLSYALDGAATPGYVDPISGLDLRTYEHCPIPAG